MDASSAIILYKAGLHSLLARTYNIVLPTSVYIEITAKPYAGSREYEQLAEGNKIGVQENTDSQKITGMERLDTGEYDAIQLFYNGVGSFIITDDGPAARYCKKAGVPFINALLFPVILRFAQIKDDDFCVEAMERIIENGRYSYDIISFAKKCSQESITFAIP